MGSGPLRGGRPDPAARPAPLPMKQVALASVLVLVAALAWLALGDGGTGPGPDAPAGPAVRATDPDPAPRASAEAPPAVDLADDEAGREEVAAAAPARAPDEAPAAVTFLEQDPAGLEYRVVIDATDEPLPGAHVIYLGAQRAMAAGASELLAAGGGLDAVLDRFGRHYRADDEGRVRIGDPEAEAMVRARGELEGVRYAGLLEPGKQGDVVRVLPVEGFDVTVVDVRGGPVPGATLELQALVDFAGQTVRYPMNAATTDADGSAFLANILVQVEEEFLGLIGSDTTVVVTLAGFFATIPQQEVALQASTPAAFELVRPDVGEVVVTLRDAGGGELTAGHVSLFPAGAPHGPDTGPPDGAVFRSVAMSEGSAVTFDTVQRGVPFDLTLSSARGERLAMIEGARLAADQERLELELVVEAGVPRLTGRALDGDLRPLAGVELVVGERRTWSDLVDPLDRVVTDAQGAFEALAPWLDRQRLSLQAEVDGETLDAPLGDLGDLATAGRTAVHLGDVVLRGPRLLAAGRVVDAEGGARPVPLLLGVVELAPAPSGVAAEGSPVRRLQAWDTWQVMSGQDGRFEVRGHTEAVSLSLSATSTDLVGQELVFPTGSTDLLLVLDDAAHVTYALDGLSPGLEDALFASFRGPDDGPGGATYQTADGASPPLRPGPWTFTLTLGTGADGVLYEEQVTLAAGEHRDLGTLVLARHVHHYRVTLELPEGVDGLEVHLLASRPGPGPDGTEGDVYAGHAERRGDGSWDLYALEPLTRVQVFGVDDEPTLHVLVEGDNHLVVE